jgi:predicted O-methyltransferase YrrM
MECFVTDRRIFANAPEGFWGAFPPDSAAIRAGRSVRDGYARGWGLQFNNLRARIVEDSLYREAVALTEGRSVMGEANRLNLYLILRYFLAPYARGAHIVEFGTYRGGNALFMAHVVRALYPGMRVYALDTFEGMPATDKSVDAHGKGDFADTNLEELRAVTRSHGLDNVDFVKGLFEDSAPGLLTSVGRVALAHIDCDIYSAVAYAYEVVRPYMAPGGYLVFDDATTASCLGATEAVESLVVRRDGLNSEQIYPQFVFRAP